MDLIIPISWVRQNNSIPLNCDELIVVTLTDIWGVDLPNIILRGLRHKCQPRILFFLALLLVPIAIGGVLAVIIGVALVGCWRRRWQRVWQRKTESKTTPRTETVSTHDPAWLTCHPLWHRHSFSASNTIHNLWRFPQEKYEAAAVSGREGKNKTNMNDNDSQTGYWEERAFKQQILSTMPNSNYTSTDQSNELKN